LFGVGFVEVAAAWAAWPQVGVYEVGAEDVVPLVAHRRDSTHSMNTMSSAQAAIIAGSSHDGFTCAASLSSRTRV